MNYTIPYGKTFLSFELNEPVTELKPKPIAKVADERKAVQHALQHPMGTDKLVNLAKGKQNAVIVINDITRPSPSRLLVDELTRELNEAGIQDSSITLLIATGNHRANSEEEMIQMIGPDNFVRFACVNHNASDSSQLIHLGTTTRGLEIEVNRLVVEADLTITTGIITPHQAAGFSGGRKSIVPGVAGLKSLTQHHSFPIRSEQPAMGLLANNPFHEEALEAARVVGVDFIVNVVKNMNGEIISVVAGDLEQAHNAGVRVCRDVWGLEVSQKFDITIVSPGGHPKDFDMHQAQKALASAELITRSGGSIILVAECPDGVGKFGRLLMDSRDPLEVIEGFRDRGFDSKNHSSKAFMYARCLLKHNVYFITDHIEPADLKGMFFYPSATIESAYANAKMKCEGEPSTALLPYAVDCILKTT